MRDTVGKCLQLLHRLVQLRRAFALDAIGLLQRGFHLPPFGDLRLERAVRDLQLAVLSIQLGEHRDL